MSKPTDDVKPTSMHDTLVEMLDLANAELDKAKGVSTGWLKAGHDQRIMHLKRAQVFLDAALALTQAGVR